VANVDHVRWIRRPELRSPAILAAFTGWNDAGDSASAAIRHLVEHWNATPLAEIDPEEFTDFATIRPHVRLADGHTRQIVWPTVGLWSVSTPGADVILVLGPEPSLRWRLFSEQLLGVAESYDASLFVTLGALLADVPHRRDVQVIGTATDQSTIDRFDLQRSRYEGPTGIVGVLHDLFATAEVPSASLWAAVPAYASQVPSPKAAVALLQRASELIGSPAPVASLEAEIDEYENRIDAFLDDDDDMAAYVRRLELMSDAGISFDDDDEIDDEIDDEVEDVAASSLESLDLDDSESLMQEIEGFLRDQRND
jgi:hypothetical protein